MKSISLIRIAYREKTAAIASLDGTIQLVAEDVSKEIGNIFAVKGNLRNCLYSVVDVSELVKFVEGISKDKKRQSALLQLR
mmetsp:Transcript_33051/g.33658  ORF Transcript_33051/g.33658 Transcript_33051/m.33658 type:complete len:81 (-) Transcript_33051:481-723(-)